MSIAATMLFLAGALTGAFLALGAVAFGHRRHTRLHHTDPVYAAAHYAAVTQCRRYGSLTHAALRDALDVPDMTVERYLDMLEREGVVKKHGHDTKTFYTRA